ncbi:MAG TPA: outer membrane beta-barrel protein [Thermoanaerobaculia bacterium]|nr:outer membrane beta-barrel protein [Thermoanaerobaculia bacterium]
MSFRRTLALLGLLALGTTSRAAAAPWIFRLEGGIADYSSQTFSSSSLGYTELSLDGGKSYGVAGEYRFSHSTGVELSLSSIDLDASWRRVEIRPVSFNPTVLREFTVASDSGTFSLRPLAVTFLIHPLRQGRLDFYVGPQIAWVDFHIGLEGPPDRDPELGIGAKLGVELAIARSPWSAGVVYRFLETQHEGIERDLYTGTGVHLISGVFSYRGRRAGS